MPMQTLLLIAVALFSGLLMTRLFDKSVPVSWGGWEFHAWVSIPLSRWIPFQ